MGMLLLSHYVRLVAVWLNLAAILSCVVFACLHPEHALFATLVAFYPTYLLRLYADCCPKHCCSKDESWIRTAVEVYYRKFIKMGMKEKEARENALGNTCFGLLMFGLISVFLIRVSIPIAMFLVKKGDLSGLLIVIANIAPFGALITEISHWIIGGRGYPPAD